VIFGYDAAIEHLISEGRHYEAAFVSFPDLMLQYAAAIRVYAPQATLIYDTVDLHGIRHRRAAELSGDAEDFKQADYYDRVEAVNILAADRIVAISAHEARLIAERHPDARVFTIPNIHSTQDRVPGFAERNGLLFIGHYLHAPNQDAGEHLARDILPAVRASLGDIPLFLVGSSPTELIKGLAGNGVYVAGHVPDVKEYFDRCRVFAAPLRFGAGMKGKIGQSMSLGLPVVTTSVGAEGMDLENGETAMLADNPQDFVAAVVQLYRDEALWREISCKALQHVGSRFSTSVARTALQQLLV
jgi:glycosyltransferase involved in cell wall biosynthesis